MTKIIEHKDEGLPNIQVGDVQQPSIVPVKMYQDVYHQITGRTEQISKRYDDNLLIGVEEISQLHHKIMQLCDVHNVIAKNETITVFHEKERKEQFTSFKRFSMYNTSSVSPTVNVVLKYNFSIVVSGSQQPQEYTVTIRLASRLALLNELRKAPPFIPTLILEMMAGNIAEVKVEYADYVVARGFIEAFDEWVAGCHSNPENRLMKKMKRFSFILPKVAGPIVAISTLFFSLDTLSSERYLAVEPIGLVKFAAVYITGLYLLVSFANLTARLIEDAIDRYMEVSYINLNKGDLKIIGKFSKRKKWMVAEFIGGCILTVVLGILSSKLANFI